MSTRSKFVSVSTLALVAGLALAATSNTAFARGRTRSFSAVGPGGRSLSRQAAVTAGNGNRSAVRSVQGANGRGATRDLTRTYDPASGTVNRNVTTTTNSGATWSHSGTYSHSGSASP